MDNEEVCDILGSSRCKVWPRRRDKEKNNFLAVFVTNLCGRITWKTSAMTCLEGRVEESSDDELEKKTNEQF